MFERFLTMSQPEGAAWVPEYAILPGMITAFGIYGGLLLVARFFQRKEMTDDGWIRLARNPEAVAILENSMKSDVNDVD